MRIKYDRSVDAAYIYLRDMIPAGAVKMTYSCDPAEVKAEINLDFDDAGRLIGIEILEASLKLPSEIIDLAEFS
jgi:uncharacterized protein YuzE